jgi:hypothetical protein
MRAKTLLNDNGERVFAVIFETGDDPMAGLMRFAEEQKLGASGFTAIGAFNGATLGYFDWDKKDYPSCTRMWSSAGETAARAAGTCSRRACGRRSRCCSPTRRGTCAGASMPPAAWR